MNPPSRSSGTRPAEEAKDRRFAAPAVTLPKGGGAIKSIGEKFGTNPVTGTGSLSIPLPLSPGRSGFTPALALSYDSGAGNGPYGIGWSVGYPNITRRTDRGLPRYDDRAESDVYLLSGAEDLVPVLRPDGSRFEELRNGYRVTRYRPRIEGLFARIERWSHASDASDTFWRSISRDNVTTVYGKTASSRIADPTDPTRIFTWLLCESFDDKGNATVYDYLSEDGRGVDVRLASEANRTEVGRSANRYLKRVRYGNRTSRLVEPDLSQTEWLFEVVMDYGDHDGAAPGVTATRVWTVRPDPFSSSRAGFEVRTYRRCSRIMMFHRVPELGPEPKLVRSLTLDYDDLPDTPSVDARSELGHAGSTRLGSFLRRAVVTGFADDGFAKSMPPLELTYSRPVVSEETRRLDEASAANLPAGVDGARAQWVDLDSEGISGVLSEQGGAWWYKPNLGQARLGPQQVVAPVPSLAATGPAQFLDLAGDGQLDVVQLGRPVAGFFERDEFAGWSPFRAFASQPNLAWDDRNLRLVDLTGDGRADVLITEDDVLSWHRSLGEDGFGAREASRRPDDEDAGPKVVFADGTDTVFLADMSGDGLNDLVRVRNGEVCYWPNLGYGRFGRKVTMDDAPRFDAPDQFDPRRLRLADVDGSGVVDIIYLARDGVRLFFNRAGNSWTPAYRLSSFPPVDNVASVNVVDLLGTGTACLVWSTPLPDSARAPLRYVDLMAAGKPHLLVQVENNLGARTRIEYTTSTRFYLEDQRSGRPWVTRLPFPVHVVERVVTFDDISRNRFVTRYAYHHGHYDGVEREFRGFGMVEQRDTEEFSALDADQQLSPATNVDAASHVPPVLTRTWFHTGVYLGREHVSDFFAGLLDTKDVGEYYREPGLTDAEARRLLLDDTSLPPGLRLEEAREASRALKGSMLRQEVYALDATAKEPHPFTVTEQSFTVRMLQAQGPNAHAVFLSQPREAIGYHYERAPEDPRVAHSLTLEVDDFGNVRRSAAVAYGRRRPDQAVEARDQQKQAELHVTYDERDVTNAVEEADAYRAPVTCETRSYHVTGMELGADRVRFTLDELIAATSSAVDLRYEEAPTAGALERRIIQQARTLYRRDDLAGGLPLGRLESRGLPFEAYQLALTPELVAEVYGDRVTDQMLEDEGRYVHGEGDARWWIPSGRVFFSAGAGDAPVVERAEAEQHFFQPRRFRDPFGDDVRVVYEQHDLLVTEMHEPLENVVTSEIDYRVLQPRVVTDPNGNRAAVAFDALGMVIGTAIMGKADEVPRRGDSLIGLVADLPDAKVSAHLDDPLNDPHEILRRATTRLVYDLFAYHRTKATARPSPAVVYVLTRETHDADLAPGELTKIQHVFSYSDGFGREIQKKAQAEPGRVPRRDPVTGRIIVVDGQAELTDEPHVRWVGIGWTIFDNKGNPVRQFEPFFTDTQRFEADVRIGVSPTLFYDTAGRVVATLHPDHTWEKVVFDAWRQESWDVNDTVLLDPQHDETTGPYFRRLPDGDYLPTWHSQRTVGTADPDQENAAIKTEMHAATPSIVHADSLGRSFLTIQHNRFERSGTTIDERYATRVELDIEGSQVSVTDAKDRTIVRYHYDMLGADINQASMEGGARWTLNDVAGKPIYAWDSRDHRFHTFYDVLRRPTESWLSTSGGVEQLVARTEYGETQPGDPEAANLRGHAVAVRDQAGVMLQTAFDFKGNQLRSETQLAVEYKATLDWSAAVDLEPEIFRSATEYDALNRPVVVTTPDDSVQRPTFNDAGLLETITVNLRGAPIATTFVSNIDYDAKGQRQRIAYGNGVKTDYEYDPLTFRLSALTTKRASDGATLQGLSYAYDPTGNITRIRDAAQQTIFFANQVAAPDNDYTYDAIYRLITATGREHIGQVLHPETTWDDRGRVGLPHPGDAQKMRPYTEHYEYDPVGNFERFVHVANNGNWTRSYDYDESSLLEPTKRSNRLSRTTVGGGPPEAYTHDAHGNMTAMPHLPQMEWDLADALRHVSLGGGGDGYYVYDAGGERVRKVVERNDTALVEERIYLGGFEIFRKRNSGGTVTLERETLHVMDDARRVALVESRTRGNDGSPLQLIRYQFSNHLGSASLELDDQAQIVSCEENFPYGCTSYLAMPGQTETPKRYRYSGMERDEESGFVYLGARYLAPWIGRFGSVDPDYSKYPQWSSYCYAVASPSMFTDPSGRGPSPFDTVEIQLEAIEALRQQSAAKAKEVADFEAKSRGTIAAGRDAASKMPLTAGRLSDAEKDAQRLLSQKMSAGEAAEKELKKHRGELTDLGKRLRGAEDFLKKKAPSLLEKGWSAGQDRAAWDRSQALGAKVKESQASVGQAAGSIEGQLGEKKPLRAKGWKEVKPEVPKAKLLPPGKGGGGGGGGGKSGPSNRWSGRGGGGGSPPSPSSLNLRGEGLEGFGPKKDPYEVEIEEFERGGVDIATGLARGGPAGAFKALFIDNPQLLPKAAVIAMQSPSMLGARGGLGSLAAECMNPANCMKSDWRYVLIDMVNVGRRSAGKKEITWGQLASGNF